ncbi:MAG: PfkB family carbohydrate kinase, partial [Acetobacteraceae bacterium]
MIVVFGSINLDLIFAVPHLPSSGETVIGPSVRLEPGGKGANQAVAAARDGADVVMVGAVGHDSLADHALTILTDIAIDLSRVKRTNSLTGCAAIAVDPSGNNAITVGSGANLLARQDQVEDELLSPSATLVLQMEVPADQVAALIRRARSKVGRIILNLAPAGEIDDDALQMVDLLIVNETEAAWLAQRHRCDSTAAELHAALGIGVIRTL